MYPILIDLGRFKLHSYGLMMFIAFVVGIFIANRRGKAAGLGETTVLDISTLIIIFGLLGGRSLYVITHFDEFRGHLLDIISPIQSNGEIGFAGLVLLGGVILGFAAVAVFVWRKHLNFLTVLDVFAPSLALGIAIGRIGCFLNGCCFGLPTKLPWGMVFPRGSAAGSVFPHIPIQPTQLYAFLYGLALTLILLWAEKRFRTFPGFTWSVFMFGYGILRFLNEMIRWQEPGLQLFHFSHGDFITVSQTIALAMIAAGIILFALARKAATSSPGVDAKQAGSHA